jgi:RNA polymerase sigma-70 factor (ECF subfamily)
MSSNAPQNATRAPAVPATSQAASQAPAQATGGKSVCCGCGVEERGAFVTWVGVLVRDHRDHLLRLARRQGLTPEDAFDVVQEAFQSFLTLPASRPLVDAPDDSRKLLAVLTRNLARNRRRAAAVAWPHESADDVVAALAADVPDQDELLASAEDAVRLRGCLNSLGDVQRAVVTLRMLEEKDAPDVARALRLTPGHVAVLLHRAKANLLSCMTGPAASAG